MRVEHREISGQPGFLVGNDGVVWTWWWRNLTGRIYRHKYQGEWTRVTEQEHNHGYVCVPLYEGKHLLHRVVLEAFVGPCPDGLQARHLDGNKTHNWLSNLAWGTQSENEFDKRAHGTAQIGERNGYASLTNNEVHQIRELITEFSDRELAELFCVTRPTISRIRTGKSWSHV